MSNSWKRSGVFLLRLLWLLWEALPLLLKGDFAAAQSRYNG